MFESVHHWTQTGLLTVHSLASLLLASLILLEYLLFKYLQPSTWNRNLFTKPERPHREVCRVTLAPYWWGTIPSLLSPLHTERGDNWATATTRLRTKHHTGAEICLNRCQEISGDIIDLSRPLAVPLRAVKLLLSSLRLVVYRVEMLQPTSYFLFP